MRFATYREFKRFVWDEYVPLPEELPDPSEDFVPGTSWARRHAPRFFRALRAIEPYVQPGRRLLDIGTYPGSFARLARACFGDQLEIAGCGMPVTRGFLAALARDSIEFRPSNLDPDVVTSGELPEGQSCADLPPGIPYESDSFDIITCMEVVEHLYSLRTLMTECCRVLKPGGILYITTNNIMDRVGLLRIFREQNTNLDYLLDQTTIWCEKGSRGHVRFYSVKLLSEVGARAGLQTRHQGYFQNHEDPDVIRWPDLGPLAPLRRFLRGRGEAPPISLRILARSLWHIGPRALASCYDSHLEITFAKPVAVPDPDGVPRSGFSSAGSAETMKRQ